MRLKPQRSDRRVKLPFSLSSCDASSTGSKESTTLQVFYQLNSINFKWLPNWVKIIHYNFCFMYLLYSLIFPYFEKSQEWVTISKAPTKTKYSIGIPSYYKFKYINFLADHFIYINSLQSFTFSQRRISFPCDLLVLYV